MKNKILHQNRNSASAIRIMLAIRNLPNNFDPNRYLTV